MIKIKRAYQSVEKEDGFRVLVDRMWPRGLSKEKAKIDLWLKDIAPSNDLRKWFAHDPKKWEEFQKRYKKELQTKNELIVKIKGLENDKETITLIYSAKDDKHNNALVLMDLIQNLPDS